MCPHEGSFLVPLPSDPLIGALIDERYRVEGLIAKGAVGSVYKAKQELLGRQVALKVLHGYLGADPESLVRFHREAKAISRLEHPNLLTLYDFGMTSDGQPYFVMDLLNGTTLAKVLTNEGRLDARRALTIVRQVLEALSEAHKKGIVHRDIKPPNIVLVEKEETKEFVKLVDFSIAKMADTTTADPVQLTVDGIICGSPAYMSPEQCRGGDVDGRSDIYSIGIVLFEALTGKRPFSAKDLVSLMYLHVNDNPPKLSDVEPNLQFPAPLEDLISSTLAKDPAARPQNVEALMARLTAVLEQCSDSLSAIPAPIVPSADSLSSSAEGSTPSPLFTTEVHRQHGASSDTQDIFIDARAKIRESSNSNQSNISQSKSGSSVNATNEQMSDLGTASLIELSNSALPSYAEQNSALAASTSFDASPSVASGDAIPKIAHTEPVNAASASQSYAPNTQEFSGTNQNPPQNESSSPSHSVPQRHDEAVARRDTRTTGSHSHVQEAAVLYRNESEWTPNALKMILPLIAIIVVGGLGILKIWDLATPDTPAEMLSRGHTEKAIQVLESRMHSKRLTEDETSTLHTAYLNLARKYANQNKYSQAVNTLRKIPPNSQMQEMASRLMQNYRRDLNRSGGR